MRAALLFVIAACNQGPIGVHAGSGADYGHAQLDAAVDKFVAAGRTPDAFHALASTVSALRPGMDRTVAEEAERKLIVLSLDPMKAMSGKPMDEQVAALALTVWPTLLEPAIEADALLVVQDDKAPMLVPAAGEDAKAYLERLCGSVLGGECKHAVPELQGAVVDALVIRRATERVRTAVADCLTCGTDPGWHDAVAGWEALDRDAAVWIVDVARRADHENWPVAGNASGEDPALPEAELNARGELVIGEHTYGPNQQRLDIFKELRGSGDVIALHVHPETTLAELRAILVDAHKAGCTRIAVIAREGVYPWRRRIYWVADGNGMRANLRSTDQLQLLLHAIDEVAGPGTVARVD